MEIRGRNQFYGSVLHHSDASILQHSEESKKEPKNRLPYSILRWKLENLRLVFQKINDHRNWRVKRWKPAV